MHNNISCNFPRGQSLAATKAFDSKQNTPTKLHLKKGKKLQQTKGKSSAVLTKKLAQGKL